MSDSENVEAKSRGPLMTKDDALALLRKIGEGAYSIAQIAKVIKDNPHFVDLAINLFKAVRAADVEISAQKTREIDKNIQLLDETTKRLQDLSSSSDSEAARLETARLIYETTKLITDSNLKIAAGAERKFNIVGAVAAGLMVTAVAVAAALR